MDGRDRDSASAGDVRLPATRHLFVLDPSPGRDNFALWCEQTAGMTQSRLLDEADRAHFAVHVDVSLFGTMNVSTTRLSHGLRQIRTSQDIARTGLSHIVVQLFEKGMRRDRSGSRDPDMREGDLCIVDLARPSDTILTSCTILALVSPREDLPPGLRDRDLGGRVARAEAPAAGLLAAALRAVAKAAPTLTTEEGIAASRALLLLVDAAFPPLNEPAAHHDDAEDQELFTRACAHIEREVGDPELSLASVAETLGVSRTSLYRLFEEGGGATNYIRERRLLRSHEIIDSDLRPNLSLGEIGISQGFGSTAYFYRAYKERFGITPGAARKAARARRQRGEGSSPTPKTLGMPPHALRRPGT